MPRRNLVALVVIAVVALLCYQRVEHSPYARYLSQVLDLIDRRALEHIPQQELFEGAMAGIVKTVNGHIDENTAFISEAERMQFEANLEQEFGGVGVMIKLEEDESDPDGPKRLVVVNPPLIGTPAHKAGIRARDEIVRIDGEPTARMSMSDIVDKMRGVVGTTVVLSVLHPGDEEPVDYTIERATINLPSVLGDRPLEDGSWDFRLEQDPRIGYVRVVSFGRKTAGELEDALEVLKEQGAEALLLELRDNSGGQLDAAVDVCRLFIKRGQEIVSIRGRNQRLEDEFAALEDGPYLDWPMAVLVNDQTASASEIVAACLQDHGRAVIVGTRTFGKGTVQHLIKIESGKSLLKLTAAKYWRPSNKNIHRNRGKNPDTEVDEWGVIPDEGFRVELTEEQLRRRYEDRSQRDLFGEPEDEKPADANEQAGGKDAAEDEKPKAAEGPADPQLQRAVEELQRRIEEAERTPQAA